MKKALLIIAVALLIALPLAAQAGSPIPGEAIDVQDVKDLVKTVVQTLITIAGLACVAFLVYGGMMMAMSAGNDTKFKQGKDIVRNAIIGAVVIFGVGVIVNTIADFSQEPSSVFP